MAIVSILFAVLTIVFGCRVVLSQEGEDMTNLRDIPEQENMNIQSSRLGHDIPDMRVVLNNLLRYENSVRYPTDSGNILSLSSRSKGALVNNEDPLAILASGFHGSRGKRTSYDEIPVFANGFPANRGRK